MYPYLKYWLVISLITAILIQGNTNKPKESADSLEFSRLEKVWNEAHLNNDAEALEKLWADDLIITVTNMPVMTKSQALSFLRSGRMKFQRYETSDIHVRVYDNSAVVSGKLQRTRNVDDQKIEDNWQFTKMYVRQQGRWQVVAFHSSTIER
jgi:hypothetical protein